MYASQSLFIITNPYIYYFLLCVCMHLTKNNVYKKCVSNIWPRFFYLQLKKTLVKSNLPFGILRHARYLLDRFRRMPTTNVMTDPLVLITIWPFGKITNVRQILKKNTHFHKKKYISLKSNSIKMHQQKIISFIIQFTYMFEN